jgi:thymidylate synthase (FAD)
VTQIELSSDLKLDLVDHMGTDLSVVNAARVSLNQHSDEMSEKDAGLINYLMKNKHASPFEHCQVSFLVSAPIVVVREWHRHRTQSYNEVSGRYTELQPKFYAPDYDRPLIQTGKPGAYKFEVPEDDALNIEVFKEFRYSSQTAWDSYQRLLSQGIAKEVARMVLPLNIYTGWYATANLRNWINFLVLRTGIQAMWEISDLAGKLEEMLSDLFPVTMETWDKNGREGI